MAVNMLTLITRNRTQSVHLYYKCILSRITYISSTSTSKNAAISGVIEAKAYKYAQLYAAENDATRFQINLQIEQAKVSFDEDRLITPSRIRDELR